MKLVENFWQAAGAKRKSAETRLEDGVCHAQLTFVSQDLSKLDTYWRRPIFTLFDNCL